MRKIPLLLIVLLSSFMLNAQVPFTKTYNEGDKQYTLQFTPIDGTTCSVKCVGFPVLSEVSLEIPSSIVNNELTYTVTVIEENAFTNANNLCPFSGSLTIPATIKEIKKNAFRKVNLTSINFEPNSNLEIIGEDAFYAIHFKTDDVHFVIPSSVKEIGVGAFESSSFIYFYFYGITPPKLNYVEEETTYEYPWLPGGGTYTVSTKRTSLGKIENDVVFPDIHISVPYHYRDNYKNSGNETWNLLKKKIFDDESLPTFVGSEDNDWFNKNNWSYYYNEEEEEYSLYGNGIDGGEDAIVAIADDVEINHELCLKSFGICGSYNDGVHSLNGSVSLVEGGELYLMSPAYGDVGIKKTITPYSSNNTGWYTISSPFKTMTETNLMEDEFDLFRFDEPNSTWINAEGDNGFNELELGHGYLYAHSSHNEIEMRGDINPDNVSYFISNAGTSNIKGFNLIGNPFAHNITMDNLGMACTRAEGFYTLENAGNWVANKETASIAPGTGFLIKVAGHQGTGNSDSYELTISKEANYKSPKKSKDAKLTINVSNKKYNDKAYVYFREGLGLDKISHINNEIPMISVSLNNTQYAIATVGEETKSIPVRFEAKTMGEYTINIKAEDYEVDKLVLLDRMNGVKTNMLTDTYTFIATSNDNPNRFVILLNEDAEEATALNDFIYINNKELVINNIQGNATIDIYDVLGRNIATYRCSDNIQRIGVESLSTGLYIVRKSDESGINVQKIIIE